MRHWGAALGVWSPPPPDSSMPVLLWSWQDPPCGRAVGVEVASLLWLTSLGLTTATCGDETGAGSVCGHLLGGSKSSYPSVPVLPRLLQGVPAPARRASLSSPLPSRCTWGGRTALNTGGVGVGAGGVRLWQQTGK